MIGQHGKRRQIVLDTSTSVKVIIYHWNMALFTSLLNHVHCKNCKKKLKRSGGKVAKQSYC